MRRKRKAQQWFTGQCQKSLPPGKGYQVVPDSPTTSRHHTFLSLILKIWKINEKGSWNCRSKYKPQPGPMDSPRSLLKKTEATYKHSSFSRNTATPSSVFRAVTRSATASTSLFAFFTATPIPTASSMSMSLKLSPKAITLVKESPWY